MVVVSEANVYTPKQHYQAPAALLAERDTRMAERDVSNEQAHNLWARKGNKGGETAAASGSPSKAAASSSAAASKTASPTKGSGSSKGGAGAAASSSAAATKTASATKGAGAAASSTSAKGSASASASPVTAGAGHVSTSNAGGMVAIAGLGVAFAVFM